MESINYPWRAAFIRAAKVELAGAEAANIENDPVFSITTVGLASNPLADFINKLQSTEMAQDCPPLFMQPSAAIGRQAEEFSPKLTSEAHVGDNLHRQLCRQWLKYRYLGVGQCCIGGIPGPGQEVEVPDDGTKVKAVCRRMHYIPANTGALYGDYAFKGLPKPQRQSILQAIKAEREDVGTSAAIHFMDGVEESELPMGVEDMPTRPEAIMDINAESGTGSEISRGTNLHHKAHRKKRKLAMT